MRLILMSLMALGSAILGHSQDYVSYMTGDTADAVVQPEFGIVMMGGAGENDPAMIWFLEKANGGDVLVIRASGSDGYNDYLFSDLGVEVNSVETIVWNNANASQDEYVLSRLNQAEAVWMAGGDQFDYVSYWKDTAVEDALNHLVNVRGGVIGGTSAGMAVLGGAYFSAEEGTVYSSEMLEDPYNFYATIGAGDFLDLPFLSEVITDTHYDDPDRRGRHAGFLARLIEDYQYFPIGIGCEEYTAVCVDETGKAYAYGESPQYEDYVYFLRPSCQETFGPESCVSNEPLTWVRNQEALKVLRIAATEDGDQWFDLSNGMDFSGGEWQHWWMENEELFVVEGEAPDCGTSILEIGVVSATAYPNPGTNKFTLQTNSLLPLEVFSMSGVRLVFANPQSNSLELNTQNWSSGVYLLKQGNWVQKWVKLP
jgi:cyanophycinase-like exopeptidase